MMEMTRFRAATVSDLPDIHKVWWAADPFKASQDNPWFGHVLRTGSMMVATVDERVIGFAGIRQVGATTVVSDCFVDPAEQARGVGTGLLSHLLTGGGPVMTMASRDPKARSLYSRFGMAPQWECHYVEGDPFRLDGSGGLVGEVSHYPIADSDLRHLRDDLGCRLVEAGEGNAALSADAVESSLVTPSGNPRKTMSEILGWAAKRGRRKVSLHLSDRHPGFSYLVEADFTLTAVDTLFASPGAEVPDPTRTTFNGDILRLDAHAAGRRK